MRVGTPSMTRVGRLPRKADSTAGAGARRPLGAVALSYTACITAVHHAIIARLLSVAVGCTDREAEA